MRHWAVFPEPQTQSWEQNRLPVLPVGFGDMLKPRMEAGEKARAQQFLGGSTDIPAVCSMPDV